MAVIFQIFVSALVIARSVSSVPANAAPQEYFNPFQNNLANSGNSYPNPFASTIKPNAATYANPFASNNNPNAATYPNPFASTSNPNAATYANPFASNNNPNAATYPNPFASTSNPNAATIPNPFKTSPAAAAYLNPFTSTVKPARKPEGSVTTNSPVPTYSADDFDNPFAPGAPKPEYTTCDQATGTVVQKTCLSGLVWNPNHGINMRNNTYIYPQCTGSCDLMANMVSTPKPSSNVETKCPTKEAQCKTEDFGWCNDSYLINLAGNPDGSKQEVKCPVDTRHNGYVPLTWVPDRKQCDFCYNVVRPNGLPCCYKYDDKPGDFISMLPLMTPGNENDPAILQNYIGFLPFDIQ